MPCSQGRSQKAAAKPGRRWLPEQGTLGHQLPSCHGPRGFQRGPTLMLLRTEQGGTDKQRKQSQRANLVREKGQILHQRNPWGRKEAVKSIKLQLQRLAQFLPCLCSTCINSETWVWQLQHAQKKCAVCLYGTQLLTPQRLPFTRRVLTLTASFFTHTEKHFSGL